MTRSQDVLFLSVERFRGPLTINTTGGQKKWARVSNDVDLNLSSGGITLNNRIIVELTPRSRVWAPVVNSIAPFHQPAAARRWQEAKSLLQAQADSNPLAVQWLQESKENTRMEQLESFPAIMGKGKGLTPTGDDFIIGFLLIHFLAPTPGNTPRKTSHIVEPINQYAKIRTTALSANLISLASQGQADERIMDCARWLLIGEGRFENIVKELRRLRQLFRFDTLQGFSPQWTVSFSLKGFICSIPARKHLLRLVSAPVPRMLSVSFRFSAF